MHVLCCSAQTLSEGIMFAIVGGASRVWLGTVVTTISDGDDEAEVIKYYNTTDTAIDNVGSLHTQRTVICVIVSILAAQQSLSTSVHISHSHTPKYEN